ncbi:MAG TPA: hypothetical protein VF199_07965 [Bacillales bacterium]
MGDFLFQTNWMAVNKEKKWLPLLAHCAVYTGCCWTVWIDFRGGFLSGVLQPFLLDM